MSKVQAWRLLCYERIEHLELLRAWLLYLAVVLKFSNKVLELFLLTLHTLTPVLAIAGHVRPSAEQAFQLLNAQ
ncbi:hypothetical protein [Prochlorococcus marinus]|uniref:hypothetical protein n=1 Tax=Prochlorococcus marinus TaxID=1219 RepID=UPI00032392E5|nr:hypothetical protein [Prochlorococcus marinus]